MTKRRRIRYDPANDLYVMLGVQPSATVDEIRRSFRQRAKEVHPDHNRGNSDWAHDQFQRLNEAYDILSDPALRPEYDRRRSAYHRPRGPDGLAWWERPHPTTIHRTPDVDTSDAPPPIPNRRATGSRAKRQRTRPYEVLFVISAFMLVGSICTWMINGPRRGRGGTDNIAALGDAGLSGTPTADPLCSSPDALITAPVNGENVAGAFTIRGTAAGPDFAWYKLEIAAFDVATEAADGGSALVARSVLTLVSANPIRDGPLTSEDVTRVLPSGEYLLRLTVWREGGAALTPCEVRFHRRVS